MRMLGFLIMLNVILMLLCIVFIIKLKTINPIKSKRKSKNILINLCVILSLIMCISSLYTGFRISGQKIILEYDLSNDANVENNEAAKNKSDYSNRLSFKDLIIESLKDIDKAKNKLAAYTILSYGLYLMAYFLEKSVENEDKKRYIG